MPGPQSGPATGRDRKDVLHFLTCGSVDDGKSTLIGRILVDAGLVVDDQIAALERDSLRYGSNGRDVDYALLLDGLEAEREQGVTIDVAYRYMTTARRAFIVADSPGHEQYTRNMVTAASGADLAVILVDARTGIKTQTRRQSTVCALMGIRHVLLAVNKMDLAGHSQEAFDRIVGEYRAFAARLEFESIVAIPISARAGDNVVSRSEAMPWYVGPTVLEHLESVDVASDVAAQPFRMPVQRVNRPNAELRAVAGRVTSGRLKTGDSVAVARGGRAVVTRMFLGAEERSEIAAGDFANLVLGDHVDVGRGDLLAAADAPAGLADQFAAHLVWMDEAPLLPGRSYLMRIGTAWTPANVTGIRHRLDVATSEHLSARRLAINDIGYCNISTASPVPFDRYSDHRETGGFILVDRQTMRTVAAGMIVYALRRASNLHPERLAADMAARAAMKQQEPCVIWFTGLSGSGKSTIARALEARMIGMGYHTYMMDGDNLRLGLNRDLGFTAEDRVENIRRAGEVARLFVDAGLVVLAAFISPFRAERQAVRDLVGADRFVEVFVDTPIEECMRRDPKGLYAKALSGEIRNFTGVDSPYERPERADVVLDTEGRGVESSVEALLGHLRTIGRLSH